MQTWLLPQASVWARSLGWALLHSLWQGLAIYAAFRLLLLFMKNANARIKYGVAMLALMSMFAWFIQDWATCYQQMHVAVTQVATTNTTAPASVYILYPQVATGSYWHSILSRIEGYMPLLTALYMAGLICMLLRFCIGMLQIKRLRSNGVVVPDTSVLQLADRLQYELGISRKVKVYLSTRVSTPMVTGALKPVILLPVAIITQLGTDQLEAIILHELAHIKRHDYLLNILQVVVETMLFFNPFVWLLSAAIRREREHCCDDMVVANTPQALSYAQALAQLAASRETQMYMALAATGHKDQLFHRIKRIMEMKQENTQYGRLGIALMLTIIILVSIAWLTPALAQTAKKDEKKITKTTITHSEKYVLIDSNGNKREYNSLDEMPQADRERMNKDAGGKTFVIKKQYTTDDDMDDTGMEELKELGTTIASATAIAGDALKNINWTEIDSALGEAKKEISGVDWASVSKQVTESMKQINDSEMRREISIQVQRGIDKGKKAMTEASVNMSRSMAIASANMARDMQHSSATMERVMARTHGNSYDAMLDKMDDEGLINREDGFKIEKKNDELYINGKRQPTTVYERYSRYLNGKKVTIKGDDDNLNINVHQ